MTTTIAVSGKGGSGKTTIAAMMVRYLVEHEKNGAVLAVDADPNSCLGLTLGIEPEGIIADIREEAISKSPNNPGVDRLRKVEYGIQQAITEANGFDLLTMGRPEGPSCYCAVNNMLRKFLDKLSSQYKYVVIDNEAGMEHLSRRTTNNVDFLFVVAEQTPVGELTAGRILELTQKLPIIVKQKRIVWNKMNVMKNTTMQPGEVENNGNSVNTSTNVTKQITKTQNEEMPALNEVAISGHIPYDNEVFENSSMGRNIFELEKNNPAYMEVVKLLDSVLHDK
jgi:CO dehydrogenase maturation factor